MSLGLRVRGAALVMVAAMAMLAQGQMPAGNGPASSSAKPSSVEYLFPEQVNVPAGKATKVALHFRIRQGLHINSHTPREDYLIPTVFSISDAGGVKLAAATYPSGIDITLPSDPGTRLNVYTGEFVIDAQIVAAPGNHLVEARLHFQACDQSACFPPRTIPVAIDVIGK